MRDLSSQLLTFYCRQEHSLFAANDGVSIDHITECLPKAPAIIRGKLFDKVHISGNQFPIRQHGENRLFHIGQKFQRKRNGKSACLGSGKQLALCVDQNAVKLFAVEAPVDPSSKHQECQLGSEMGADVVWVGRAPRGIVREVGRKPSAVHPETIKEEHTGSQVLAVAGRHADNPFKTKRPKRTAKKAVGGDPAYFRVNPDGPNDYRPVRHSPLGVTIVDFYTQRIGGGEPTVCPRDSIIISKFGWGKLVECELLVSDAAKPCSNIHTGLRFCNSRGLTKSTPIRARWAVQLAATPPAQPEAAALEPPTPEEDAA